MNKLYIIKIGGNVLDDEPSLKKFLKDFAPYKLQKFSFTEAEKLQPSWATNWASNQIM